MYYYYLSLVDFTLSVY